MAERVRSVPDQPSCRSRRHDGDDAPPRLIPGLQLCSECRDQAEEELVELPELYEMCAYMLDLRRPQPREPASGRRPRGIVLRDAVVTVRSDILGVLASWCGLVTSERGVTTPDELSIRRLTSFVHVHFTWLVAHPAAPEFADELTHLTDAARDVLQPKDDTLLDLGPCARPGCAETVRAEGHPPKRVRCDAGHAWAPEQWLLLRGDASGYQNGHPTGPQNGHTNGHHNGLPTDQQNGHRMDPSPEEASE